MKKVWIMVCNNHLGYEQVEVLKETQTQYRTTQGAYRKDKVFFREIDVINALISQHADQLSFYRHCVDTEEKIIKQLIERKKYI